MNDLLSIYNVFITWGHPTREEKSTNEHFYTRWETESEENSIK